MSDSVTLSCLINGESADNAFSVNVNRRATIDQLKQLIEKRKKLDDHTLDLWGVSIPEENDKELENFVPDKSKKLRPARKISEYFQGDPARNSIHIIVKAYKMRKAPVTGLSESDILNLCPPPLTYAVEDKSTGNTVFPPGQAPQEVVPWDNFKNNVNNVSWDKTPKYPHPAFRQYRWISTEEDIREAVNLNVFYPLEEMLEPGEFFTRHHIARGMLGEPDFTLTDSERKPHLVVEVKAGWVLSADDLLAAWERDLHEHSCGASSPIPVYHSLRQIFGYLSHNRLQFAALTTYDQTWFLYRPPGNPEQLRVSPAIRSDSQQPTLFQCFLYVIRLARNEYYCTPALPSLPRIPLPPYDGVSEDPYNNGDGYYDNDERDSPYKGRLKRKADTQDAGQTPLKRSKVFGSQMTCRARGAIIRPSQLLDGRYNGLEFFDWNSFRVLDVLGEGRSGKVFKAILRGETVALKICDLWQHPDYEEELVNEVEVYHTLEDLQGSYIPKFKGAGYTAGGLFAIATSIAGRPLKEAESLSDKERQAIQTALKYIHRHGFVHNDIRDANILIELDDDQFRVSFIDFAFSKRGCRSDFSKEMRLLAKLLSRAPVN